MLKKKENEENEELDNIEYNAGRIIGMLERIIIFFLVIAGQFTAIGLVIAAKGFTRFKELEDRQFAEYVLVGTFLSAIFSIAVAVIIKSCIYRG
jgi:cytochrome b subunit of formate dehydrogenase